MGEIMNIRQEIENDFEEVYVLIKEAFETAEHADGTEQDLVVALRKGDSFIPELSLVVEIDGQLVGHILFSKAKVGSSTVLALAPLTVKSAFQRRGVGSELINEAHKIASQLGFEYIIVLGSERYYPKFGYLPAEEFNIIVPEGIPPKNLMAIKLQGNANDISGEIIYAKEFGM